MTLHRSHWSAKAASSSLRLLATCVVLASVTASCGSDTITSEGDNPVPATPRCAQGELAVTGILDDLELSDRISGGYDHAFINKLGTGPGTFDANKGSVAVHLEWGVLLPNGQSTSARGWARGAGFDVGNPPDAVLSGTLSLDGDGQGGHFLLKELHHSPYGSGAAVRGAVAGCFRY